MVCNIGGFRNRIFVARNQHTIFGQNQIRLNIIGALVYRDCIAGDGMFRPFATRAAVGNDDRFRIGHFRLL